MVTESASPAPSPMPEHQPQLPEAGLLLEVVIEQPGTPYNVYVSDRAQRSLRLEQVVSVEPAQPADLARTPLEAPRGALDRFSEQMQGTSSAAGEQTPSLPVFLLSRVAIAPGVWVTARLIGALRVSGLDTAAAAQGAQGWVLLAVPQADPDQEALQSVAQLASARREALVAQALRQAPSDTQLRKSTADSERAEWMEAPEAAHMLRQIRATWRHAQRQQASQARTGSGPREHLRLGRRSEEEQEPRSAWRALAGVSRADLQKLGLGAYAEAEHLLRFVPQRFQQYLGELLLEDERVLCFIERPRLQKRRGLLGLGARYLNEGILLCTDRQVLWLRDVATPDATLVPWGYVARSCPVERLANVQIVPAGQANQALALEAAAWPRLVVQSGARQGTAVLALEFPENALPALEQAVELLERFLPQPPGRSQAHTDRRVRRVPSVSTWEPHAEERDLLLQLGGMTPPEARERLHAALADALPPGEPVLAQAVAPAMAEYRGGPRLLAITRERLFFGQTEEARRGGHPPQTTITPVPLAQVAAVQLRHSLLGCAFEVGIPQGDGQIQRQVVPFHSPAIVPFRAIYTRARLLIAGPYPEHRQSGQPQQTRLGPGGKTL